MLREPLDPADDLFPMQTIGSAVKLAGRIFALSSEHVTQVEGCRGGQGRVGVLSVSVHI